MILLMVLRKKRIIVLLAVLFLCMFVSSVTVYAEAGAEEAVKSGDTGSDTTTVRVGYYENEVFEEGASPGAVRTGYAYEYYRKLSEYTGWKYEYVYGGFGELYEMLLSGDIDMMAGLARKDDRIGLIGYPEAPMGNETYTLVRHLSDDAPAYTSEAVSGKKIGVLNSAVRDVLSEYLSGAAIEADIIGFDDYESLFRAFDEGTVDILAAEGDGAKGRDDSEIICTFGHSDYYLCVSIDRPDLLEELNEAQSLLAAEEPLFISGLQNKYYSSSVSGRAFSAEEREWIANNHSLRVGYLNNYLPYSTTGQDGEATGIVKDIFPAIFKELSIPDMEISYAGYDSYDDMINDVVAGQVDVCFPVGGGLYYSEENGIYQSTAVTSSTTDLVYHGEYETDDPMHFAVNENNRMQYYYIQTNYPEAEITFYPDIDSCLMAVLEEEVGATTLNGLRANEIMKNTRYSGLSLRQLNRTDDRSFGVRIGNEGLLKLLNRGIKVLGSEYTQEIAYEYVGGLYSYTLSDRIRDNIWLFLVMLLIIAVLVIVFIIRNLHYAREATRMKSDFVSNMSHEIRTPVTAIVGMNEMIQRESNDENILKYADNIEKAGKSLIGIINDILDFSKIEAGRMELNENAYSLPELLGDLNLLIKLRADEKDINFSMKVDEKLPVMPVGDVQKIRQVITNLLTNAVKYTEEGEVILSLKLVSGDKESFVMRVSVEDTGIGIKKEEMNKLFSAFERLDEERTRSIEGSGLGLAITRRLLAIMGSEIDVTSEYGKGSCFSFVMRQGIAEDTPIGPYIARDPDVRAKIRKRRSATFTAPTARVLLVDDTPMNLQVICGLLKGNDLLIDTAGSGEACIDLFENNSYDIVFLDQRMPHMDGVETLLELKKRYPEKTEETPMVCLTANALSGAREQMLEAGFTDYLTKPVNLTDMEEMLLKYLPGEKIQMKAPQDESKESTIPKALKSIHGLDAKSGIEYCGDEEEYLEAIAIYRASVNTKAKQLKEHLEQKDTEKLSLLLHSLKSTSRSIGASALAGEAEICERQLKESAAALSDPEFTDRVGGFIREYIAMGDALMHVAVNEEES